VSSPKMRSTACNSRPSKRASACPRCASGSARDGATQVVTGFTHVPRAFCNRDTRRHVEALLGRPYSAAQIDLRSTPATTQGLIHRIPERTGTRALHMVSKLRSSTASSIFASCGRNRMRSCPTTISSRARSVPLLITSTLKSRHCTTRPPLPPEQLASIVTISLFRDV